MAGGNRSLHPIMGEVEPDETLALLDGSARDLLALCDAYRQQRAPSHYVREQARRLLLKVLRDLPEVTEPIEPVVTNHLAWAVEEADLALLALASGDELTARHHIRRALADHRSDAELDEIVRAFAALVTPRMRGRRALGIILTLASGLNADSPGFRQRLTTEVYKITKAHQRANEIASFRMRDWT